MTQNEASPTCANFMNTLTTPQNALNINDKNANSALSYDAWLKQKVNASLAGLLNGNNHCFSAAEWLAIRTAKKDNRNAQ